MGELQALAHALLVMQENTAMLQLTYARAVKQVATALVVKKYVLYVMGASTVLLLLLLVVDATLELML